MKKIICTILVFVVLLFSLCSCKTRYVPVVGNSSNLPYFIIRELPTKNAGGETTLEFWIGEIVNESDYEGHVRVYDGFLGAGYSESVIIGGNTSDYYVHYTVRNYPKVDSKTSGIVSIEITDPSVKIYGLTTESSLDDFAEVFEALGAKVTRAKSVVNAKLGDVSFQLDHNKGVLGEAVPQIRINTLQSGIVHVD